MENNKRRMMVDKEASATKAAMAATAVLGTVGVTAIFKKEARKAIMAGMVMGVATPFIAKAVAKKVKESAVAQAVIEDISERVETKLAEAAMEALEETEAVESNGSEQEVEAVKEAVSVEEFEHYKDMVAMAMNNLIENMKVLDERTLDQRDNIEDFSKLLNNTVSDISKTYIGITREVKEINKSVKESSKENQAAIAVKEYLEANRKMILEELGIKGSDLIAHIDPSKFSNEAIMAATMEMIGSNFVDVIIDKVNENMVSVMRKEIKETGIARDLDNVKAFIEVIKEGKALSEEQ